MGVPIEVACKWRLRWFPRPLETGPPVPDFFVRRTGRTQSTHFLRGDGIWRASFSLWRALEKTSRDGSSATLPVSTSSTRRAISALQASSISSLAKSVTLSNRRSASPTRSAGDHFKTSFSIATWAVVMFSMSPGHPEIAKRKSAPFTTSSPSAARRPPGIWQRFWR